MTDDNKAALVPFEEKQVEFYGDELTAVMIQEKERAEIYVPMKPIVEYLGLTWPPQYSRIQRDPVLSKAATSIIVTVTEVGQRGEMLCLPLKFLPGFLFGISVNRVREELRERIIRYQEECYDVLWEAFREGRLTADPYFTELVEGDSPAALAYRSAMAIARLARQQLLIESRLDDHERRLETMEATLYEPSQTITEDQASQISQAVKAVALELGRRSGRNEYGGVYGELYRKFGITSYKNLPAGRFSEALDWLTEWYESLTGDQPF